MPAVNFSPLFNGYQSFLNTGIPNNGGLLNTYQAGTSTPQASYQDSGGTTLNANPIVLDSSGRPPAEIWLLTTASYKFVLTDSGGVTLGTFDNITGTPTLATSNTWGGTQTFTNQANFSAGIQVTGNYIGDFTNASIPARTRFVSSVTNGITELGLVPNGSGGQSGLTVFTDPTPTNCAFGRLSCGSSGVGVLLESNILGAGSQGPLRFAIGTTEVARFNTANQFLVGTLSAPVSGGVARFQGIVQISNSIAVQVNRGGVNQATIATGTFTKVQLNNKAIDQDSSFDAVTNFRWIPKAGTYIITGNAQFTNLSAVARTATLLYKNGAVLFSNNVYGTVGQASGATVSGVDVANGTDYYEVFCWHNSGNNETLSGLAQDSFITGARLG